jgi:hypothetical protein
MIPAPLVGAPPAALRLRRVRDVVVGHLHDARRRSTPPTRDLMDLVADDLLVLDLELATNGVVMERLCSPALLDVESGEVAAGRAAVSGRHGRDCCRSTHPNRCSLG